jgi:UDP-2,4-diacetamido-2,4,6-trideoxy-beta-L-altropyranose hydrolase
MISHEVKPLLLIRADADGTIGSGHVMRSLALAREWRQQGGEAIFMGRISDGPLRERIFAEGCQLRLLSAAHPDPSDQETAVAWLHAERGQQGWVLVDGYHFDTGYHDAIRATGWSLLVIDDFAHLPKYHADILLNPNAYAHGLSYHMNPGVCTLLGSRYAPLRREFRSAREQAHRVTAQGRRILVTMGGADPDNVTCRAVDALLSVAKADMEVKIVIGPLNPHHHTIGDRLTNANFQAELLTSVSHMASLMQWADLAISAGGSTCLELATMGVPMVLTVLADNQERVAESLAMHGAAINLHWHHTWQTKQMAQVIKELLADPAKRQQMAENGQRLVDGQGSERVVRTMRLFHFSLRPATENDCETIFQWANDPQTRAASFHPKAIIWQEHCHWFATLLADRDYIFFIAVSSEGRAFGQVRFALGGNRDALISVGLDRDSRGTGIGSHLIRRACDQVMANRDLSKVRAMIRPENSVSIRAFTKAGFRDTDQGELSAQQPVIMEYTQESTAR